MMELEQQNKIDSEALGSTKYKSGLIFLHGLGGRTELKDLLKYISGPALGLSMSKNKIVTPKAPSTSVAIFPPSFIPGGLAKIRSWFNFWLIPAASVVSPVAGESKNGLKVAMKWVEEEIEGESKEERKQPSNTIQGVVFKPWINFAAHQQKINSV